MGNRSIYKDISERTQGDIYIGVVGPVRTGKSTFIKKFMEALVVPNIENSFQKERTIDELPQSSAGRTIMTAEPKFIPNEAIEVRLKDNAVFKVRMIDCVGYIVPSALGYIENDTPRMVMTPWYDKEIPFNMAAEIGTKKVINEHSTIGLVVTTDGSIGEIPRAEYEIAEERVIKELKEINKPFIILLNCVDPQTAQSRALATELQNKYDTPVLAINCLEINEGTIKEIMESVLFEFPVKEVSVNMPGWIDALDDEFWLKKSIYNTILDKAKNLEKIREIKRIADNIEENENIDAVKIIGVDLGNGSADIELKISEGLFYKVLGETTGLNISNEAELISVMKELSEAKGKYDKYANAIREATDVGYGIVTPAINELTLEQPEMVKQGGRFGIRLKASAPSLHIIRADIETEVSPIVGSERQSEELVKYLLNEFEESPEKIWESNIFGKSLHELVNEGLHNKLNKMPVDAREKMQETLQRIINEGSGGLICIIL